MPNRFWFDTEFIEYPCTIDLISIGMVDEKGNEFYAISKEFNEKKASKWVQDNVITKLPLPSDRPDLWKTRKEIKEGLLKFIGKEEPEFWAYHADYDWVVFCWLFGTMMDLPDHFPTYCMDLKQSCVERDNKKLNKLDEKEAHDALGDAKWLKQAWRSVYTNWEPVHKKN